MGSKRIIDVKTTTRSQVVDVTSLVRNAIRAAGIDDGIACLYCPHTTAGVTLQENTDPNVKRDLISQLTKLVPRDGAYATEATKATNATTENNSDAHIKSSLIGHSITFIVEAGKPVLGTWQAIYFCEFDGPRNRTLLVRVVPG